MKTFSRRDFVQGTAVLAVAASSDSVAKVANVAEAAKPPERDPHLGPFEVQTIENVWIPMSDGTRIAARLWLPEDADRHPVPCILEYIPYRKRDANRAGDEGLHPYLASHGYACIRPDIRGSGDSDGLPQDEYVQQEQDDGVEIIAWLAKQPWCTGKVGMFGISWGGFSSLQVAARRPPALKAIIAHCSSDDRYADDAHYTGGCINECMFNWGSTWMMLSLRPPDPAIVGTHWREQWLQRLQHLDFYPGEWLNHPHRDQFWKHGSICENYADLSCAVYLVGGWVDPFRSTVARMLTHLHGPRKGLIGPWGHQYPHHGNPGPAIDWVKESLRWWDYWLKDIDTQIMSEPLYRVWMQETPALRGASSIPGRWVAEDVWPSPRLESISYYLSAQGTAPSLEQSIGAESVHVLKPLQTTGLTAPRWYAAEMNADLPTDQRVDDARSLCFDSAPLPEGFDILGSPRLSVELAVDKPVAFLAARLNEITADGVSKRLSYAILNLTQREGANSPQPLESGKRYRIELQLQDCAQTLQAGSRLRIALSSAYWPMIWPSPEPVTLTVYAGCGHLELPKRPPRAGDQSLQPFDAAPVPPGGSQSGFTSTAKPSTHVMDWDVANRELTARNSGAAVTQIHATGTEITTSQNMAAKIQDDDPATVSIEYTKTLSLKRRGWDTRCEATLRMSSTKDDFLLTGEVKAFEADRPVFSKAWNRKIPRQLI